MLYNIKPFVKKYGTKSAKFDTKSCDFDTKKIFLPFSEAYPKFANTRVCFYFYFQLQIELVGGNRKALS